MARHYQLTKVTWMSSSIMLSDRACFLDEFEHGNNSLSSPPALIRRQTEEWHCRNVQNAAGVVNGGFCSQTPPPDSGVIAD